MRPFTEQDLSQELRICRRCTKAIGRKPRRGDIKPVFDKCAYCGIWSLTSSITETEAS